MNNLWAPNKTPPMSQHKRGHKSISKNPKSRVQVVHDGGTKQIATHKAYCEDADSVRDARMIRMWITLVLVIVGYTRAQSYLCPPPWQSYQQSCYLFDQSTPEAYIEAINACEDYGAALVSVNDVGEHSFVIQQLRVFGSVGQLWYTSGIVNNMATDDLNQLWYTSGIVNNMATDDLKWEGDGRRIEPQFQWWSSHADMMTNYTRIVYKTDKEPYGWSRVSRHLELPYICEILQVEAFRISQDERDFTYGTNLTDRNFANRGPVFKIQPGNLVVVTDSRADDPDEVYSISVECFAEGHPLPTYRVLHTLNDGKVIEISSETDGRYTLTGGRLSIHDPVEELDSGFFQWVATNPYGTAKSDLANITFGVLGQFSNVIRAPVIVKEYQSAVIECGAPTFKPALTYQWYRERNNDFVRPDLNPHLFVSSNGKLYFSEVTQTDESDYRCFVQLAASVGFNMSSGQPPSRVSLNIPLDVTESAPQTWGPVIADGFIATFPNIPRRGFNVKLECLAYGTLPLTYSWTRDNYPMPEGTTLSDHNRVLEIPNVQLADDGTYRCTVARTAGITVTATKRLIVETQNRVLEIPNVQLADDGTYRCTVARTAGITVTATKRLIVETKPYFILPLSHQHADVGSQLTWRCEAKAIPRATYTWYKDGEKLETHGDYEIRSNVLRVKNLDAEKHNGTYQCAARNTHGQVYSAAQLRVLAFKPNFIKHPLEPSQSAAIGSHTTIVCNPEAAPKPEFTWTRNGGQLNLPDVDDGTSRVRKLADGSLYINDVQMMDAGTYACTATNTYGKDTSTGYLNVVASTVITTRPQNTVTRVNNTGVMVCAASFPYSVDYAYVWKFNGWGVQIQNHPHYRLGGSADFPGALYVTSAQYDHTGVYTCIAKTAYAEVNASAFLRVEGPPGPPAGVRADTTTISNTSITLIWYEGRDHGRPVQYHSIEANTEHNKTFYIHINNIPVTQTQILGTERHRFKVEFLKPSNGYTFRVRAINDLGVGHPSRPSVIYKIPGAKPTMYPENINGGGGSVGTLVITWDALKPEDQAGPGIGYKVYWRRQGTGTKYLEYVIEEDAGTHSVTVGADTYYLEYEVKVAAFNDHVMGPMSSPRQTYVIEENADTHSVTVGADNYYLEYEVKVGAFNDHGMGPVSPDGLHVFSAPDLPIGVSTNVYAWPFNSTALWVSWQIIPNDRANMKGPLLGYQVNFQLKDVPDASLDAISWRGESDVGVVIGLDPYTWYTVDIQVLTIAGMGPRSEVFHAKTYKLAPILYPTEVNVYPRTKDSVTVMWRGVSTTVDEENLEGYKVRFWQTTEDARSAKDVVTERGVTETVIYGVMKDIVYECRVLGYSRGGDGKHSESILFTLGGRVPFDPTSSEIITAAAPTLSLNILTCIILHIAILLFF